MLAAIRDKLLRLGRDEDGAAMVVTLAVFMFMYLVCIGVYAIGMTVKARIHLQNACDAAAYSAAVVQADTLSRIATINRAMAWTYANMTMRQMDYIAYKFLDHAQRHVHEDASAVIGRAGPGLHDHPCWYVGPGDAGIGSLAGYRIGQGAGVSKLSVNGRTRTVGEVADAARDFISDHLPRSRHRATFYGMGGGRPTLEDLRRQIWLDMETIERMNKAERDLADGMPRKIDNAARSVLAANCGTERGTVFHFVNQNEDPRMFYMRTLSASEEGRFLRFAGLSSDDPRTLFGPGSGDDEWFPRQGGAIMRSYRQGSGDKLHAEWNSWACSWICTKIQGIWSCVPTATTPRCDHRYSCDDHNSGEADCDECRGGSIRHAYLRAEHLRPDRYVPPRGGRSRDLYEGVAAEPLVLTQDFFGGMTTNSNPRTGTTITNYFNYGTITVCAARRNENPWASIIDTVAGSIYSAFNQGAGLPWTPQYTVCVASARAGYKQLGQRDDDRGYRVDWQGDQPWNLCQSDWDAVLVPVRRAESIALMEEWIGDAVDSPRRGEFLREYIEDGLGVRADDMRAGGDGSGDAAGVSAEWVMGSQSSRNRRRAVDWKDMERMMFH